nr:MAG: small T antigen [Polyomaviridae sp.]
MRRCKDLHPDKGGDEAQMKKLNELYRKMEAGLADLHESGPSTSFSEPQVKRRKLFHFRESFMNGFSSHLCERGLDSWYIRDLFLCGEGRVAACNCLMCTLRRRHRERFGRRPAVWVECFCFDCFVLWFGSAINEYSAAAWQAIIAETPWGYLHI